MEKENPSFKLAIYKLLEQYPLYDHRIKNGSKYRLPVLLMGDGDNLNTLRDTILSLGQLLDTQLEVTVASPDIAKDGKALLEKAPELGRFIRIQGIDQTPDCQWELGKLIFEPFTSPEETLAQHPDCRYVLIGPNIVLPKELKPKPRQLMAQIEGDGIRILNKKGCLLSPARSDSCLKDLEKIAYALHLSYEKGNDPKITEPEIREKFQEAYNYESNIECALHIRSKIKCAGIDPSSLNSAAEEFAKKLEDDARDANGTLLDRLARLEHERWCISKLLRKFTLGTPEKCYSASGVTTHDPDGKWHIALVPYGNGTKLCRRLSDSDWNAADPESIADLDELDKQTLRVHKACFRLAMQRRETCFALVEKLVSSLPDSAKAPARAMKEAMEQMYLERRRYADDYRHHLRTLERLLPSPDPDVKDILVTLKQQTGPILEYLSRKDYKQQNFVLVSRIPFALSHWKKTVLVKLMADRIEESISSVWQLEPHDVCYVDIANTAEELMQIRNQALQIDKFLRTYSTTRPSFRIFVPQESNSREDDPFMPLWGDLDCWLYPRNALDADDIRPKFVELMHETEATAIDMTGGKPELITIADGYARNSRVGAFFIRNNSLCNYYGARGMANQVLDRSLSVEELFAQSGAEKVKQDSEFVSDIFREQFDKLWDVAFRTPLWYRFCQAVSKARRKQTGLELDKAQLDEAIVLEARRTVQSMKEAQEKKAKEQKAIKDMNNIIQKLCDVGVLEPDSTANCYRVSCEEALWAITNAGKALEYYIYCSAAKSLRFNNVAMSWLFRHSEEHTAASNELDVVCTMDTSSLFISAKHVSLDTIKTNNFLNYVCYEVGWLADRFGGLNPRTVLAAPRVPQFEKDGSVSKLVKRAMERGVYLLGDACFEPNCLGPVLEAIAAESPDSRNKLKWCDAIPCPAAV